MHRAHYVKFRDRPAQAVKNAKGPPEKGGLLHEILLL